MNYGSMTHDFYGRKIKKKKARGVVYDKYTPPAFKELVVADGPYQRETKVYKSLDVSIGNTERKERMRYTGTLIKGIATMHKSNAVPILNQQEAIDIANMRRS
tara:strand:+ start:736 stop:1044 length:309 start_codon:yes stop_codon:yes gene_type:complete